MGSIGAVASLAGAGFIILTIGVLKYNGTFVVAAIVAAVGMVAMFLLRLDHGEVKRSRFAVKRKYALYYVLSFLDACRRHIFITFAIYGLVKIHGVGAQSIAILMFVNNGISIYSRQVLGRLVDRIGERNALVFNYSILVFVFLGYAYINYVPLLYVLYCLDNTLFGFSMARTTYLDRIAPREDVTASIAFGITLNHVAAIALLPASGYMWERFGYETPFLIGVAVLIFSIVASTRIKPASKKVEEIGE